MGKTPDRANFVLIELLEEIAENIPFFTVDESASQVVLEPQEFTEEEKREIEEKFGPTKFFTTHRQKIKRYKDVKVTYGGVKRVRDAAKALFGELHSYESAGRYKLNDDEIIGCVISDLASGKFTKVSDAIWRYVDYASSQEPDPDPISIYKRLKRNYDKAKKDEELCKFLVQRVMREKKNIEPVFKETKDESARAQLRAIKKWLKKYEPYIREILDDPD